MRLELQKISQKHTPSIHLSPQMRLIRVIPTTWRHDAMTIDMVSHWSDLWLSNNRQSTYMRLMCYVCGNCYASPQLQQLQQADDVSVIIAWWRGGRDCLIEPQEAVNDWSSCSSGISHLDKDSPTHSRTGTEIAAIDCRKKHRWITWPWGKCRHTEPVNCGLRTLRPGLSCRFLLLACESWFQVWFQRWEVHWLGYWCSLATLHQYFQHHLTTRSCRTSVSTVIIRFHSKSTKNITYAQLGSCLFVCYLCFILTTISFSIF